MDIKKLVEIGMNKDIVVYDADSGPGQLSIKLISLLIYYFEETYNKKPTTIILPLCDKAFIYNEFILGRKIDLKDDIFSIMNITINFVNNENLSQYYKNNEGSFPYKDLELCLAYNDNEVLLGSY